MLGRRANHEGTKPRQRKDGRFVVNVWLDGSLRSSYGKTAAEARRAAKQLVDDHARGANLETASATLADFLDDWLETSVRRKRPNTYQSYEIAVRVHIIPHPVAKPLGQIPLGKLRKADVEAWVKDRAAVVGVHTLWRLHAVLRAGLNRAVKCDPPILIRNPASQVEPIDVDQEEIEPLTAREARHVLVATEGTIDHAFYAAALSLGPRLAELLALRWATGANDPGFDLERGEVRIYRQIQHGQFTPLKRTWHRRVLPLSTWLVAVLERHIELLKVRRQMSGTKWREQDLVFPSAYGTPRSASNTWLSWKRLQKRLGIPGDHTIHDLRHTFATMALDAGVPLWKVSKMLGHRDISITLKTYGHLTREGREDVAERMEGVLAPRQETKVTTKVNVEGGTPNGATSELEMTPFVLPGGE